MTTKHEVCLRGNLLAIVSNPMTLLVSILQILMKINVRIYEINIVLDSGMTIEMNIEIYHQKNMNVDTGKEPFLDDGIVITSDGG